MPVRGLLSVLLVAAATAGCSSSDEETLAPDTFTLRVDGGEVRTLRGSAFFSREEAEGQRLFAVFLGAAGGPSLGSGPYVSFLRFGAAPGMGTFALADILSVDRDGAPDPAAFFSFYFEPGPPRPDGPEDDLFEGFHYARSGTFTVERIDDDAVEGRFEMTVQRVHMTGFDPEDPDAGDPAIEPVGEPVAVEGEFNASFRRGLFGDLPPGAAPLATRR